MIGKFDFVGMVLDVVLTVVGVVLLATPPVGFVLAMYNDFVK